ncbi:hypothetical protein PybrP1_011382 [[Pythium] brassicae (nom. inval.)]|nr:hypothetical protein PybrP1_011382 [[Pythium] brassicae (nom. inval.)]
MIAAVTLDATGTLLRVREPIGATYARFLVETIALDAAQQKRVAEHVTRSFPGAFERMSVLEPNFGRADARAEPSTASAWWGRLVLQTLPPPVVAQLHARDAAERFASDVYAHYGSGAAWLAFPDARPTLEALRSAGVPLGVVSNFDERLHSVLRDLALRDFFDVVATSWDVGEPKPHASIFTTAFAALTGRDSVEATFADVLHVGDHKERDYNGARAAGAQARWLQRRPSENHSVPAQHVICGLDELLPLVARSAAKVGGRSFALLKRYQRGSMHDEAVVVSAEDVANIADELTRDFDRTCLLLANELATSRDPALLLSVVRCIASQPHGDSDGDDDDDDEKDDSIDDNDDDDAAAAVRGRTRRWLSDELLERFETDFLPQAVQLVLARQFDTECVGAATAFLQFVMVKAKTKLLSGDPCLLPSLARILDDQRSFYYSSIGADESCADDIDDADSVGRPRDGAYRFVAERSPYVAARYLANVEFWGDVGGFSLFLTSLRSTVRDEDGELDTVLSFEAIQCVFRTVYAVKDHLASGFLLEFFPAFCAGARAFVRALAPSEFLALSREALSEVAQVVELVLGTVLQAFEQADCNDAATEEETTDRWGQEERVDTEALVQSVQLLRLEMFVRQFRSSSLEKRIHGLSEIVSLFTCEFNDQVERQLRPTATSLKAKLEYLVDWLSEYAVMEELFGEKLHSELLKRSVPLFHFASELKSLQPQWLDLVWRCYRGAGADGGQHGHQRHEAHRTAVQEVLLEVVECLDAPLLGRLFRNVHDAAAVDSSALKLLAAIAARGSRTRDEAPASDTSLRSRSIKDQVLTYLWEVAVPAIESKLIVDQVLEQIEEIAKQDAFSDADALSDGEPATSRAARRLRAAPALIDSFVELIETFLIPKFGSLSGDRITLSTQCCLHALFRHLNLELGGLETYVTETGDDDESASVDDTERSVALATGKPLVGLEQLWHLAIKSVDSDVAEECITLLASHYLEFAPDVRGTEFAAQKQLEFVETCMDYLSPAARANAGDGLAGCEAVDLDGVTTVNRCVDLLLYFLEAKSKLRGRTFELESLEDRLQHLEIYPSPMKEEDVPPSRGPELSLEDLSKALQDASTERTGEEPPDAASSLKTRAAGDKPGGRQKSRLSAPSHLLANDPTYFDTLFALVNSSDATSQRVWELICRLPTNNERLRKMICLRAPGATAAAESVAWMNQFDTTNVHRLLYAMRLVEALLLPVATANAADVDVSSESARRQWRERFVRLGGAHYLFEALVNWETLEFGTPDAASAYTRNLSATCLAAVVRTMRYFVLLHLNGLNTEWRAQGSCAFDARLFSTTLPLFVRSIRLNELGASAVRLSQALAASTPPQHAPHSVQVEEAIQSTVELFAAVMRADTTAASEIFRDLRTDATDDSPHSKSAQANCTEWVSLLLLECPSPAVRSTTLRVLVELTTDSSLRGSMGVFVSHLVRELGEVVARDCGAHDREHLDAFFDSLLGASVGLLEAPLRQALVEWLAESRLPDRLAARLYRHAAEASDDRMLSGLLQILTSLVRLSETLRAPMLSCCVGDDDSEQAQTETGVQMIEFVLKQLVFGDVRTGSTFPACKSERSRESAQNLLLALIAPPRDAVLSASMLDAIRSAVHRTLKAQGGFQATVIEELQARGKPWNFAPRDLLQDPASGIQRAGLVNPGCVCYMNALVQQLFMNAMFRDGLLSTDLCLVAPGSSQWSDEVVQLQRLFVSLAFTRFTSTDPTAFALSHRDLDGNPTDLRVQMDADEFFCVLLDRLDTCLRVSGGAASPGEAHADGGSRPVAATFLDQCFGGVLVNQIVTQQGHVSEREEKFFALSLEVSKKSHLRESLELYVQGEALDGENAYFCERLQQKVRATKRICVKTLPQTLVCHLKRFEFDFDTMEKLKINDYLEFPQELDMFPFTSAALSPAAQGATELCLYDLVGVVVHSGTSDVGHYYSFIKDRSGAQRWLEFNDEVVREFDVDMMEAECFGGEEPKMQWLGGARAGSVQMKRRNAYMLMYERRCAAADETPPTAPPAASPTTLPLIKKTLLENTRFQSVVDAFSANYCACLGSVVDQALWLPRRSTASLSRWSGAVEDLSPDSIKLRACVLGCQYLFGVASLQPTATGDIRLHHSQQQLLSRILAWMAISDPETSSDNSDKSALSAWFLRSVVATAPSGSGCAARSWLFDLLFLNENRSDLVAGCTEALSAAVATLTRQLTASCDAGDSASTRIRAVLTDFYRALLEMFNDREQPVELVDPMSGGAVALPTTAVIGALTRLGALLESCVCALFADAPDERKATLRIVAHDLQFVDRLLFTLQAERTSPSTALSLGPESLAPVSNVFLRVRTCTLETEQRLVRAVLSFLCLDSSSKAHAEHRGTRSCRIPVDANLVLNQTALLNIVQLGFHHALAPVLAQIALQSGAARRDKLLTLLMAVLEDVKTTHVEQVLSVFHSLLDAEEAAVAQAEPKATDNADAAPVHCHVFSASKGILEAAAYYRDHEAHRGYSLQLLQFTVARATASPLLRRLFASAGALHEQGWSRRPKTLLSNGTRAMYIRTMKRMPQHGPEMNESDDEDTNNAAVGVADLKTPGFASRGVRAGERAVAMREMMMYNNRSEA